MLPFIKESLSVSDIEHILQHPPTVPISTPPVRVEGGQVCVIMAEKPEDQGTCTQDEACPESEYFQVSTDIY